MTEQESQHFSGRFVSEGIQRKNHSYDIRSYTEHNNADSLELPSEVMSDLQGLIVDCKLGRIVDKGWCTVRDFQPHSTDSVNYKDARHNSHDDRCVKNNSDTMIMTLRVEEKQLREKLLGMPSFTQTFAFRVVGTIRTLLSTYMRAQRFGQCSNEFIDNHDFNNAAEDGEEDTGVYVDNSVESDKNLSGLLDDAQTSGGLEDRCIATECFKRLMDEQLVSSSDELKKSINEARSASTNNTTADEVDWMIVAGTATFTNRRIVEREVSKISEAQICYLVEMVQTVGNKLCQMLPYSVQFLVDIVIMRVFSLIRGALRDAKISTDQLRLRELSKYLQRRYHGRRSSSFFGNGSICRSSNGSGALRSPTSPLSSVSPSRRGGITHMIEVANANVRSADRVDSDRGVVKLQRIASYNIMEKFQSMCDYFSDEYSNEDESCVKGVNDNSHIEEGSNSRQTGDMNMKVNNHKPQKEYRVRDTSTTEVRDTNFRKVINRIRGNGSQYSFDFGVFTDKLTDALDGFASEIEDLTEEFRARVKSHIHDGSSILTIGCSYTTLQFLIQAAITATFTLYIIEGSASTNGRHHVLASAVKLFNPDIHVHVLTDSSAYAVMPNVTKVFIGCDYVLATGGILAPIGTQPICMVAKHFSVPVVVLASSLKFIPWYSSNPSCTSLIRLQEDTNREAICSKYQAITEVNPVLSKPLSTVVNTGIAHSHSPAPGGYYHLEDAILMIDTRANEYIPPHLITLIVTEEKDFTTSQVDLHIRDTYQPMDALNLIIGEAS